MSDFDFNQLMKESADAFRPVATGDHVGEIIKAVATKSSNGKPMIKCTIRVVNGADAGRNFYNNFTLTTDNPKAMGMFFRHMAALGLDAGFFSANPAMEQVAAALVGRHALWTIAHREWNNVMQEDVKGIKAVQGFNGPTAGPVAGVPVPGAATPGPSVPTPSPSVPTPTPTPSPATPSGAPPLPI